MRPMGVITPGPDRPPRPPRVQRLRRLGAAEAVRQPLRLARQRRSTSELVRDPQNHLLDALPPKTQLRYAEIRALVGGVTAIQGTGGQATAYQDEALVRNVDKWIFGGQVGRALIDLPTPRASSAWTRFDSILAGIEAGEVKAFYVHLAEGRSDNELSRERARQAGRR